MNKIFYLVDNEVMKNLQWIPLANYPYLNFDLGVLFEQNFWYDLRHLKKCDQDYNEYKDMFLWSIPEEKKELFEKSCTELEIKIINIDLDVQYKEYCKEHYFYKPTKQSGIPLRDRVSICRETFNPIICGHGTTQIFLEHNIGGEDGIELYINSNENGRHKKPHCHVKYNSISNYCVLSLVDFEKIEPDGNIKNAIVCKAQAILQKNIQYAREKWNTIDAPIKFKVDNGIYSSDLEYSK